MKWKCFNLARNENTSLSKRVSAVTSVSQRRCTWWAERRAFGASGHEITTQISNQGALPY